MLKRNECKTYDFQDFIRNDYKKKGNFNPNDYKLISIGTSLSVVMIPKTILASTGASAFGNMWSAVIGIVDWIAAGVFLFAGVTWMFGRQTKGIELIICGTTGYLLARHAIDIRDFLKTI